MPNGLKMPDALPGLGIQGNQAVRKQIVANAIGTIEIGCCRSGRNVYNAAPGIECHAGPIVRTPTVRPRIFRPGVVTVFIRMRNGMERPAKFARAYVVSAYVAWRRRE